MSDGFDAILDGVAKSDRPPDGTCETCGAAVEPTETDWGWVGPPERCDDCDRSGDETAQRRRRYETRRTNVLPPLVRHRLDRLEVGVPDVTVEAVMGGPEPWAAYLHGPPGTGKTLALGATVEQILWADIRDGQARDIRYVDEPSLIAELKRAFDEPDARSGHIRDRYADCDVLVLDDLGSSRPTDWVRDEIATILRTRYKQMAPTLLASNFDPNSLPDEAGVGERIVQRIWEMTGGGETVEAMEDVKRI